MKLASRSRPAQPCGSRRCRGRHQSSGGAAGALLALLFLAPASVAAQDTPTPEDIPAVDAWVVVPGFGEFRIRFDRERSPNHVAHFLSLAGSGFYDGLTIHRIVPRLLVQAGAEETREGHPRNWVISPPGYRVAEEAVAAPGEIRRGTIAFALQDGVAGTAGTEWFVALRDEADLTGLGVPIGEVTEGLSVLDKLEQASTWVDGRPLEPIRFEVRLGAADRPEGGGAPAPVEEQPGEAAESENAGEPAEPGGNG